MTRRARLLVVDEERASSSKYPCSGAIFSPCGLYRYGLWRAWRPGARALWIMLNPSTADEHAEDPTIRRCIGYARAWELGGIYIANAFALRSTEPTALRHTPRPIGPLNDWVLGALVRRAVEQGWPIVCGWGDPCEKLRRGDGVREIIRRACGKALALHRTVTGAPGHPLYLPKSAELKAYP